MDIKRLVFILSIILLSSCSGNPVAPVKEEIYFKNYALAVCFSSPFEDKSLGEDVNKAINGYIEKGNLGLEDYEEIRKFVDEWRETKNYESKRGGQINFSKCIDMYNSVDLNELYKELTPCSIPSKDWYFPEKYFENCT